MLYQAGAEAPHKTSGTGRPYASSAAVIEAMVLVGQGSVPALRPAQRRVAPARIAGGRRPGGLQ
ncbi:MAG: hypothetical protein PVI89_11245 [Desulfobacteraceae bacterium]|jgi:hypothetical protein